MKTYSYAVILLLSFVFPAYAQQVYSSCTAPPTTFRQVWYIDPVHGQTTAAGGNGSQAHPWNSLQAVFLTQPGYAAPLLTTVPYTRNSAGALVTGPKAGPIAPGDEVLLMSGNYGPIVIGQYLVEISNPSFLTIAGAPGQTPVLTSLTIAAVNKLAFSGLKVQNTATSPYQAALVAIGDAGAAYPTSNIVLSNLLISSADSTAGWTAAQWNSNARDGFSAKSSGSYNTKCVSMTGSHITNVRNGMVAGSNLSVFSGNEIDHFDEDGIDFVGTSLAITKNYIHDNLMANANHNDAMQGVIGAAGPTGHNYANILIDSNKVIRQTNSAPAFPGYLQKINAFDEDWTNVTVTNNIVISSGCNGMSWGSVHTGMFANNTVVNDGLIPQSGGCMPNIQISDKTHEGSSSNNVILRNNLTSVLALCLCAATIEADHNVVLKPAAGPAIAWPVNGVFQYLGNPGTYANNNIIDSGGATGEFVNFQPSSLAYNVMLKAGAQAITGGISTSAPTVDILGVKRVPPTYTAGAYSYPQ